MAVSTKSIRNKPRPTARDITARRKAQEQIQLAEENYRTIFENSSVAITIADENENIVSWNRFAEVLLGMGRHDLHMKPVSSLYPEDEWRKIRSQNVRQKGMQHHLETRIIRKNQEIVDVDLSLSILKGPDGNVTGSIGLFADITTRKRAQEQLQMVEENYRTIFENSSVVITMADENENIVSWNKFAEVLLGMDKDDLYMKPISSLYPEEEWRKIRSQNVRQKGIQHHLETRIIRKNQEIIDVDLSLTVLKGPDGNVTGSIGVIADLTARKRVQEELRGYRDHLEDLVAERTTKLATVNEQLQQEITERKQAEKALRESEERYRTLVMSSHEVIFNKDRDGQYHTLNLNAAIGLGGTCIEDVAGKTDYDLLPKEQADANRKADEWVMESGKNIEVEEIVRNARGENRVYLSHKWPLYGIGGEIDGISCFAMDITERKLAEEELIRLSSAVEMSIDGIVISGLDARIIHANEATLRMYGTKDKSDLVGKSAFDLIALEDRETAFAGMQEAMEKGYMKTREYSIVTKDGSKLPVEMSSAIMKDAKGEPIGFVGISRDITERKRVEENLRQSEEKYRELINTSTDGVISVDTRMNIALWNQGAERIFGYTEEEILGQSLTKIVPERYRKAKEKGFSQYAKSGTGSIIGKVLELEGLRKDGTEFPLELSVSSRRVGDIYITTAIVRDITERKQAENTLRESEARYRVMAENMTDVIWTMDMDLRFTYTSPSITRLLGYSVEEVIAQTMADIMAPASLELVMRALAEELALEETGRADPSRSRMLELKLYCKDGSTVWTEIKASFMYDTDGQAFGILGVTRDITERKRMEEELQLAGRLTAVGELAAGIAHELNNPLAAVQMYAELLSDREDLDETTKSDVETIYKESQRATRITTNLLSFARRHKPESSLISINDTIDKSIELHAYRLKVNNIEIVTELDPDLPMTLADFYQMQQVFVNIITNAEQAMTAAHGRGELSIKTQRVGDMIQITFTDDGPGIPEDNMNSLFAPFFTTKEVGKGTGLGLSICFGIVQEHGGNLYAQSKPGKGATFVVEIPIIAEDQLSAEKGQLIETKGA